MTVALFSHPASFEHDTGAWHPESVNRIRHVMAALDEAAFPTLRRHESPAATDADLALAHTGEYLAFLAALRPQRGARLALDGGDTLMSPGTMEAARRAVGGAIAAVDAVLAGEARTAFVAARPPGHHAERGRAMGFCLFAHAAIAARHAQRRHGLARVAVLDFDVHHGNGTQDIVWDDPTLFYGSSHQMPLFPGTGAAAERGGSDNVINVPLPPETAGPAFRAAWERTILPAAEAFRPDLIVVSAGFDGHGADPLAQWRLDETDFAWITKALLALAGRVCDGRLVSVLEGGYDLQALAASVSVHVRALLQN